MRRLSLSARTGRELGPLPPELRVAIARIGDEGEASGTLPGLLQVVSDLAPAAGAVEAVLEAEPASPELAQMAASAGFAASRSTFQLRRRLPLDNAALRILEEPGSPTLRSFVPGRDEQAWIDVNNRAFAWHPDQSGWTLTDVVGREAEPWFRADGFLVHDGPDPGAIDGFCWTKIHADTEPPLGEIYVIAVDPGSHGHGLGRALAVAGLEWLAREGLRTAMLYVEDDNERALGLYADLGFTRHQVHRWWHLAFDR